MEEALSWVGEDRLIPLKAFAWLQLTASQERGEAVDARNIRKHANDILRLSQLLAETTHIEVPAKIAHDISMFLRAVKSEDSCDPKAIGLKNTSLQQILARIADAYGSEL